MGIAGREMVCQHEGQTLSLHSKISMRILYFDCFSGIAGDMTVGALRDLGVEESVFLDALAALDLPEGLHAHFHRGERQGISGWKFHVHEHSHNSPDHSHSNPDEPVTYGPVRSQKHSHGDHHDDAHPHVHGRTYAQIKRILEESNLSVAVKRRAQSIFHRIAIAEGKIHGVPAEEVGFHEVGAADSIADIVATCAGLESLGIEQVMASSLIEGSGWVHCAHGKFPLPAPATLALLEGIPLRQVAEETEFITPTGAAILADYATSFGPMPAMRVQSIGYGIGTRETPPRPNVLRAVLGESAEDETPDSVEVIETNLDDITPELLAAATENLLKQGALDVSVSPAFMKKNRPGHLLSVIAKPEDANRLAHSILKETSSFGVRMHSARRKILQREFLTVTTPHGDIQIKVGKMDGKVIHATPEFESCKAAADARGVSVQTVFRAASACADSLFD